MQLYAPKILISILLCFGVCVSADAQNLGKLGFHFKSPKTQKVKIDFKQHNNLIVVPIKINGLDTLNFVLDSGVGYTLITDPNVMHLLKLDCIRKIKVAGVGTENELSGCIVNIAEIQLKNIVAQNHHVIVLEEDVLHLSQYAGVKIHGLIGYDLFSRFSIKLNYLSQRLTFYDSEQYEYTAKDGEIFPIKIEQMKAYLKAEAILTSSNSAQVNLILDTGAGHSLSLDKGTHPNIKIPEKHIPSQLGMTLNGAVEGSIGRIDKFKLGSFELDQVITSFPDSLSIKFFQNNHLNRQGNLGCGVLKRFHIIFDYPRERLILKPNRSFKEPFEFNTSGLELTAQGEDFKDFVVGAIRKGSPAEEVGLQKGDKILSIDDRLSFQMNLGEAYKIINKKEGRKTLLFVQRKSNYIIFELKLRQPI